MNIETIREELEYEVDQINQNIEAMKDKLNMLINFDDSVINENISEFEDRFNKQYNVLLSNPSFYINKTGIQLMYRCEEDYESVVDLDETGISYNGNWIEAAIKSLYCDIEFNITIEARVPKEIKDLLRACGKLNTREVTETYSNC